MGPAIDKVYGRTLWIKYPGYASGIHREQWC